MGILVFSHYLIPLFLDLTLFTTVRLSSAWIYFFIHFLTSHFLQLFSQFLFFHFFSYLCVENWNRWIFFLLFAIFYCFCFVLNMLLRDQAWSRHIAWNYIWDLAPGHRLFSRRLKNAQSQKITTCNPLVCHRWVLHAPSFVSLLVGGVWTCLFLYFLIFFFFFFSFSPFLLFHVTLTYIIIWFCDRSPEINKHYSVNIK